MAPTTSPRRARWHRLGSGWHASITARDGKFIPLGGGGKIELRSVKVRLCEVPFAREVDSTVAHCHSSSTHSLEIKYITIQSDRANQTDLLVLSRFHPRGTYGVPLASGSTSYRQETPCPRGRWDADCHECSPSCPPAPSPPPPRFCICGSPTPLPAPAPRPPTRSGRAQFTPSPGRPPSPFPARLSCPAVCSGGGEGRRRTSRPRLCSSAPSPALPGPPRPPHRPPPPPAAHSPPRPP